MKIQFESVIIVNSILSDDNGTWIQAPSYCRHKLFDTTAAHEKRNDHDYD